MAVFVTQYDSSLSSFVANLRILSHVVAKKSLTEKKVYNQTSIITEKAKTIYPLYTSYQGYKCRKYNQYALIVASAMELFRYSGCEA